MLTEPQHETWFLIWLRTGRVLCSVIAWLQERHGKARSTTESMRSTIDDLHR